MLMESNGCLWSAQRWQQCTTRSVMSDDRKVVHRQRIPLSCCCCAFPISCGESALIGWGFHGESLLPRIPRRMHIAGRIWSRTYSTVLHVAPHKNSAVKILCGRWFHQCHIMQKAQQTSSVA